MNKYQILIDSIAGFRNQLYARYDSYRCGMPHEAWELLAYVEKTEKMLKNKIDKEGAENET